jgi:hypothetical protein
MAGNKQGGRAFSRNRKSGFPFGVVGLAVMGLVAVALYAIASQKQGSNTVDRFMHLHGLAVPPWAPDEVYVASHQGLARIDAKGEWSFVSGARHDFMGFQVNPAEEGVMYSSGHPAPGSNFPNPVGFMVSRDAGATWDIVSLAGQVDFHVMTVQRTNGDVIYGHSGGLARSLDAGRSWERLPGDTARLGNVYGLAVHPESADTILAATSGGLWRSRDAGRSWDNLIPQLPVTSVAYADDRLWAYAASPDSGLLSSEDEGENWRSTGFFLEGDDAVAYIAPRPGDIENLYVGSFGQNIYETTDGGETWEQLASGGVPEEHGDDNER